MVFHSEYPYGSMVRYDSPDRCSGTTLIHVGDSGGALGALDVHWHPGSPLHSAFQVKAKSLGGHWTGTDWRFASKVRLNRFCDYAKGLGACVVSGGDSPPINNSANDSKELWAIGKDIWLFNLGQMPISSFSASLSKCREHMVGDRIFSPKDGSYVCWIGSRQQAKAVAETFGLQPKRVPRDIGKRFDFKQKGHDIFFRNIDPRKNPLHGLLLLGAIPSPEAYTCDPERMVLPVAERAFAPAPKWSCPTLNHCAFPSQPVKTIITPEDVPGFSTPCPVGHTLRQFQREGVLFVIEKGGRSLIADEMGLGKTVQAIIASQVLGTQKILSVCPSGVTRSWLREISDWTGETGLLLTRDSTISQMEKHRWLVVSYDLLVPRTVSWKVENQEEKKTLLRYLLKCLRKSPFDYQKRLRDCYQSELDDIKYNYRWKKIKLSVSIGDVFPVPGFYATDPAKNTKWQELATRMARQSDFIRGIEGLSIDMLVIDEAHRMKNAEAKRTSQALTLAKAVKHVLLLTGTPIRNNIQDLDTLLTAVFNRPFRFGGYQEAEQMHLAKYYLDKVTIRRRKQDVLPQLPPKIRQSFPVELELTSGDRKEINEIVAAYNDADNETAWFAAVARARHLTGKIKANSVATSDVLKMIIEEKGSAIVFAHHKSVAEIISKKIAAMNYTVEVINGGVSPSERDRIVQAFQRKSIDVIVATIDASGEGITLHRTDTVVFIEFDWVPAAMWQAEDRIHRVGQQAESCYIVYIPGIVNEREKGDGRDEELSLKLLRLDTLIQEVLLKKLAIINDIHNEDNILFPVEDNSTREAVIASLPCPTRLRNEKGNHSEQWLRQHATEQKKPWLAENISRATWFRNRTKAKN